MSRAADLALATSVLGWAIAGAVTDVGRFESSVGWTVVARHVTVAGLLVLRSQPLRRAGPSALLASLPALVIGGWALGAAPHPASWPLHAQLAFAAGGAIAVASLATLGRSFAVLPAVRDLVVRGPFRVVRHPAYAGELLMIAACVMAAPSLVAALVLLAAVPFVALRIGAEERLLSRGTGYARYADRVPWRLVPGVW